MSDTIPEVTSSLLYLVVHSQTLTYLQKEYYQHKVLLRQLCQLLAARGFDFSEAFLLPFSSHFDTLRIPSPRAN